MNRAVSEGRSQAAAAIAVLCFERARIRPGQKAELVASGIPSAASMTYDPKRNRLVIPMNDWNAITFVDLGPAAGRQLR